MNFTMEELPKFKNSPLGLYDSANGKTVKADKVINITPVLKEKDKGQVVVKYAKVERGMIAQLCQWYEKGKDLGMTVHYHINELTPETLSYDSVFNSHANMLKIYPLDLARIIYHNQP